MENFQSAENVFDEILERNLGVWNVVVQDWPILKCLKPMKKRVGFHEKGWTRYNFAMKPIYQTIINLYISRLILMLLLSPTEVVVKGWCSGTAMTRFWHLLHAYILIYCREKQLQKLLTLDGPSKQLHK